MAAHGGQLAQPIHTMCPRAPPGRHRLLHQQPGKGARTGPSPAPAPGRSEPLSHAHCVAQRVSAATAALPRPNRDRKFNRSTLSIGCGRLRRGRRRVGVGVPSAGLAHRTGRSDSDASGDPGAAGPSVTPQWDRRAPRRPPGRALGCRAQGAVWASASGRGERNAPRLVGLGMNAEVMTWLGTNEFQLRVPDQGRGGTPWRAIFLDQTGELLQVWTDVNKDGLADRVEIFRNGQRVKLLQR